MGSKPLNRAVLSVPQIGEFCHLAPYEPELKLILLKSRVFDPTLVSSPDSDIEILDLLPSLLTAVIPWNGPGFDMRTKTNKKSSRQR